MPSSLLTRCPHCSTTFRLTNGQLQAANGAVRCGACLQVFHADEYMVSAEEAELEEIAAAPDTRSSATEPEVPPPQPAPTRSDLFDAFQTAREELDQTDTTVHGPSTFIEEDPFSQQGDLNYQPTDLKDDEAWADALLRDINAENRFENPSLDDPSIAASKPLFESTNDQDAASKNTNIDDELNDEFISMPSGGASAERPPANPETEAGSADNLDDFASFDFDQGNLGDYHTEAEGDYAFGEVEENSEFGLTKADESWAQAMLDELEQETRQSPEQLRVVDNEEFSSDTMQWQPNTEPDKALISEEEPSIGAAEPQAETSEQVDNSIALEPESTEVSLASTELLGTDKLDDFVEPITDFSSDELIPDLSDDIFADVPDAAIHHGFAQAKSAPPPSRFLMWTGLSLVASVVLVAQFIGFNYQTYAQHTAVRPALDLVCDQLGCDLPAQQSIRHIKGTNLIVRTHPDRLNALVVDTIVYNEASFEQPFPLLELEFRDIHGLTVAKRTFRPSEYQQGELKNLALMPSNTPIHLSIEIIDPGAKAVNYGIKFLAPQDPNA